MSWNRRDEANDVKDILGLKELKKGEYEANSIRMNEIDKDIYHDMVEQYDAMNENLDAGLKQYAPFEHLSEDIYNSLFKYKAKMNDEEDMKSFCRFNHGMMEEIMKSETYDDLRKSTQFDAMGSAIGTEVLQDEAMQKIKHYKEQLVAKQKGQAHDEKAAAAGDLIDKLNQQGNIQGKMDGIMDGVGGDEDALSKKQTNQLAKLQEQMNAIQDEIDANFDGQREMNQGMNQTLKDGSKKALDTVEEVRDIVNAWGLEAGTHGRRISIDQRRTAIERVRRSSRLKNLTDIIGRMKKLAMEKKKVKMPDGHSIETVEQGNKLESLLPSEMMKLSSPALKKDFMMRYHQKQLLQYKKNDTKTIGRGPIVFCHDKSGSMQGDNDDWATALALAMLEVAQKEKRNFAYIPYESRVMGNMVKNINAGELDPNDIMDIAELSVSGGTNFMAPLDEAVRCLTGDRYKKGDIVFVTDGDCGITDIWLEKFLKVKAEKQFFVNTILINTGGYGASKGTISKFSDNITTISDLTQLDDGSTKEIFRMVDDKDKYADPAAPPAQKKQV